MTETGYDPAGAVTDLLKEMTPDDGVRMVRELCAALGEDADSFHGNIWPGSVRIDWDGRAVLGDPSDEPADKRDPEQVEYLAPEFFWDGRGSASADVYSLGLMLYAACARGFLPFQPRGGLLTAKDRSGALRKRMKGHPINPPSGVSPELAAVIKKALAYDPEQRYITAAALLAALNETEEALPVPAAPAPAAKPAKKAPKPAPEKKAPAAEEAPAVPAVPADELPVEPEAPDAAPEEGDAAFSLLEAAADNAPEAAEPETVPAPADAPTPPKYTVQKDVERPLSRRGRAAIPVVNRKKKPSPLIPILCVLAVAVIAAAVVLIHNGRGAKDEAVSEPYTIAPTLEAPKPTVAPEPLDEAALEAASLAESEPEPDPDAPAPTAIVGSGMVDGQEVEAVSDVVEISDTGVNLRTGPGTSYDIFETLSKGVQLVRTGTVNGWSQVQYEGGEYYVATNLVNVVPPSLNDPEETPAPAAETAAPTPAQSTPVPAQEGFTLLVTADVNIRSGPGTEYDKIGEAKVGQTLNALGRSDDGKWYLIAVDGGQGYVNRKLVSEQDTAQAGGTLTVVADANLRSGPGTGYTIVGKAKTGDTFPVQGRTDNNWYILSYEGGTVYIAGNYGSVS